MRAGSLVNEPGAFVLGGNSSTLAFVNSFRSDEGVIIARLVPLAVTPTGIALGDNWQNVNVALDDLLSWIDQTFPPEDERAFVAPLRDIELLARIEWEAPLPQALSESVVFNAEDLPADLSEALTSAPAQIVQCATCRRLCICDQFVWNE
ncbi:MAG: hypothetical protein M3Y21_03715, partial [Candidatus Eremiobacteraeota bacterium]|nr:hypothetical protein [Candidatus Eremiobacteraeota bacterium]